MRLEAVKGRQQALYSFGGGLAVFGGIAALGAVLDIVAIHGNSGSIWGKLATGTTDVVSPPLGLIPCPGRLIEDLEGSLQLQDMADVNRNCISVAALCFETTLQDHFKPPKGPNDPAVCLERAAGLRIYINTC